MKRIFTSLLSILLMLTFSPAARADLIDTTASSSCVNSLGSHPLLLQRPMSGPVSSPIQLGKHNWDKGHRGVDLSSLVGTSIRAAASGKVIFAGALAGRPVISIDHGGCRTTYEPVQPIVSAGTKVIAGQLIGFLQPGHRNCPSQACLHWGLTDGEKYYDPLKQLTAITIRLLPAQPEYSGPWMGLFESRTQPFISDVGVNLGSSH